MGEDGTPGKDEDVDSACLQDAGQEWPEADRLHRTWKLKAFQ
jgi:hypothetical protein